MSAAEPRVLFVHTHGGIGDLLLSSPIAEAIVKSWPQATVTAWVRPAFRGLLDGNPWCRDSLEIDRLPFASQWAAIRRVRYDVAIHAWTTGREAALTWLAGVPVRVGQSGRFAYSWTFTHPVDVASAHGDTATHWMDIQLAYARALGCTTEGVRPAIYLTESERAEARALLQRHGITPASGPCGLHAGKGLAGGVSQAQWPLTRFVDVGVRLVRAGRPVVVLASGAEHAMAAHVARDIGDGAFALASRTPREMAALIAQMSVVISPDSGPGHIAAALGVPVVAIFAVRSDVIARWRPRINEHRVVTTAPWICPKRRCVKERCARFDCLEAFDAGEAAGAALELATEYER